MTKELKIMDLVGILLFYFLIIFGVVIVNDSLGRVEAGNNISISN